MNTNYSTSTCMTLTSHAHVDAPQNGRTLWLNDLCVIEMYSWYFRSYNTHQENFTNIPYEDRSKRVQVR